DARATTIFALVNALGRRDRARALGILDTLTREGEYLPLALAFLNTQFNKPQMERALGLIYKADKGLRDARPDDRIVMETFIMELVSYWDRPGYPLGPPVVHLTPPVPSP